MMFENMQGTEEFNNIKDKLFGRFIDCLVSHPDQSLSECLEEREKTPEDPTSENNNE